MAVPGFPFVALNEIYKSLTKSDHPVFLELFGSSFVAGTFLGGKEEPDTVINVSRAAIRYLNQDGARAIINFGASA